MQLLFYQFDDSALIYNVTTGDTHALSSLDALILEKLIMPDIHENAVIAAITNFFETYEEASEYFFTIKKLLLQLHLLEKGI
ncbi:MAG: hypothetical protein IBX55_09655 [Methyloprofundus sp.]|nr:hypothetical protein [Methyloprofundus sp.]